MMLILALQSGDDDLVTGIGSEIQVAIDRWSAGQVGLADLVIAAGLIAVAAASAWVVRRLTHRWTDGLEAPAATAGLVIGQVSTVAIYIIAIALILEVLGFGLGPTVIIVLVVAVAVMFLRPTIHNLSSGLMLQLRAPFAPGDVIETHGKIGVVEEVNTRTVILITNDGKTVHIPSSEVLDQVLVNYTSVGRRRSEVTLHLHRGTKLTEFADRLRATLADGSYVMDDPGLEVVVTGFDGTRLCVQVQFWHRPDLWAGRIAIDRVGRAILEILGSRQELLSDPTVVVTGASPDSLGTGSQ